MTDPRRQPDTRIGRSDRAFEDVPALPSTADVARGSMNLATVPRAGNVSSDTRAGRPG
jgi:hypothetical protein